jgi:hypothetical protein
MRDIDEKTAGIGNTKSPDSPNSDVGYANLLLRWW